MFFLSRLYRHPAFVVGMREVSPQSPGIAASASLRSSAKSSGPCDMLIMFSVLLLVWQPVLISGFCVVRTLQVR